MFLKIYFDDKPLFLCDRIHPEIEPYIHHDDAVYIDELNIHTIKTMIHEMEQAKVHAGIFIHPDFEELKDAFWKKFTIIQAAGGFVQNSSDEILMIFRRGKWDMPKGKLDEGESLEECAVREVEEETGLRNIQLGTHLITTYHTYHEGTKKVLKESYWYTMRIEEEQPLIPQTEEDIHEIKWVKMEDISPYMNNSYASIVDVLKAGGAV